MTRQEFLQGTTSTEFDEWCEVLGLNEPAEESDEIDWEAVERQMHATFGTKKVAT